jgi:hypothetical protein
MQCELCGDTEDHLARTFGLDVCARCLAAQFDRELSGWDAQIGLWTWDHGAIGKLHPHSATNRLEIRATATTPVPVRALFTLETLGLRLITLLTRELKAGDPLFDDRVYVSTEDRTGTALLLQNEGAQAAILELVTSGGSVKVEPGRVEYKLAARTPQDPTEPKLATMCLLRHLRALGSVE